MSRLGGILLLPVILSWSAGCADEPPQVPLVGPCRHLAALDGSAELVVHVNFTEEHSERDPVRAITVTLQRSGTLVNRTETNPDGCAHFRVPKGGTHYVRAQSQHRDPDCTWFRIEQINHPGRGAMEVSLALARVCIEPEEANSFRNP